MLCLRSNAEDHKAKVTSRFMFESMCERSSTDGLQAGGRRCGHVQESRGVVGACGGVGRARDLEVAERQLLQRGNVLVLTPRVGRAVHAQTSRQMVMGRGKGLMQTQGRSCERRRLRRAGGDGEGHTLSPVE